MSQVELQLDQRVVEVATLPEVGHSVGRQGVSRSPGNRRRGPPPRWDRHHARTHSVSYPGGEADRSAVVEHPNRAAVGDAPHDRILAVDVHELLALSSHRAVNVHVTGVEEAMGTLCGDELEGVAHLVVRVSVWPLCRWSVRRQRVQPETSGAGD